MKDSIVTAISGKEKADGEPCIANQRTSGIYLQYSKGNSREET